MSKFNHATHISKEINVKTQEGRDRLREIVMNYPPLNKGTMITLLNLGDQHNKMLELLKEFRAVTGFASLEAFEAKVDEIIKQIEG